MSNETQSDVIFPDLLARCQKAIPVVEEILATARNLMAERVTIDGRVSSKAVEQEQFAAHGLSWLATYVESLRQMSAWALKLQRSWQNMVCYRCKRRFCA